MFETISETATPGEAVVEQGQAGSVIVIGAAGCEAAASPAHHLSVEFTGAVEVTAASEAGA